MAAVIENQEQWYTTISNNETFTLPIRYQHAHVTGEGAFSFVLQAIDSKTGKYVAIKKVREPFRDAMHAKRTYRELKLLLDFNYPDTQVVQLYNVFTPERDVNNFQTLYFVLNYIDYDLHEAIQCTTFTEEHIKLVIYQLLRGLKLIHSAGIVHYGLTPQNVRIDKCGNVSVSVTVGKITTDFVANFPSNDNSACNIPSRSWDAPEILANPAQCSSKVDVWSVGAIMAELILHQPLFRGEDHMDYLKQIIDVLGTPDPTKIDEICIPGAASYIKQIPVHPPQDLNKLFGFKYAAGNPQPISGVSPMGIDLLKCLLTFDHRDRPTAAQSLAHPFLADYHDPMDEPTLNSIVDQHQDAEYSVEEWKKIIWQLIQDFVIPSWANESIHDD
ncbi:unnamed protein product [Adineta ricciae]|uniref:Protein kinase domain-containing protein n=1 Tax=Adineta ricciae TaxID=249248 RepID=A0A813QZZ0_ADIRI|nr:unnamed protein product [Adineta ricciae]